MDVATSAATNAAPALDRSPDAGFVASAPLAPVSDPAEVQTSASSVGSGSGSPSVSLAASAPVPSIADVQSQEHATNTPFSKVASRILSGSSDVHVSYRIAHNPNEIITVFTDSNGKEVGQFPPEVLVQIAHFFDQQAGGLVERSA